MTLKGILKLSGKIYYSYFLFSPRELKIGKKAYEAHYAIFEQGFSTFWSYFHAKTFLLPPWHFYSVRLLLSKEIITDVQKTQGDYFLEYH